MLRLGLIGFGSMGQWMAEAFALVPGLQIAGVAEIAPAHIRAAQSWRLPVYTDIRLLLEQPLDGVYIATPNALHKAHVLAAVERCLPIFIEKPIALTLPDAEEMISAVNKARVPALVNFSYRFKPPHERMRSMLADGILGDLLACWVRSFRGWGFFANGAAHPAVLHPEESGGWAIHHAIHGADWLTLVGGRVASVSAQVITSSPQAPSFEGVFAQVNFLSGVVGQLSDAVCGFREHSAGLMGTRGTAALYKDGTLRYQAEPTRPESGQEVVTFADEEGYRHGAAHHFAAVMRGETSPKATLEDGYQALKLCLSMMESATKGTTIRLS